MGNSQSWKAEQMATQASKVFLITGGNTGLGLESAKQLAKKDATVILACRNMEKAEKAKQEVEKFAGGKGKVYTLQLDLSDFDSIRQCSEDFDKLDLPLHVLMNNAGVMMCPQGTTKQGHELQFGVNHLGHFLLTKLFYKKITGSSSEENPGRIVNLTSSYHAKGPRDGILFDNMHWEANKGNAYDPSVAYGHSKFSNVVFTQELAERVVAKGDPIYVNCVHPGSVDTELTRHVEKSYGKFVIAGYKFFNSIDVHKGALTQLFASTEVTTQGKYYAPIAKLTPLSDNCPPIDSDLQKKLWTYSEECIGETFEI